jgi:hypothetical protein
MGCGISAEHNYKNDRYVSEQLVCRAPPSQCSECQRWEHMPIVRMDNMGYSNMFTCTATPSGVVFQTYKKHWWIDECSKCENSSFRYG